MAPKSLVYGVKQTPKSKGAKGKLRSLTSLNQGEYDELLSVFGPLVQKKLAHYTLKGHRRKFRSYQEHKNSSLYGPDLKLEFILMFMKENPNQVYHGKLFCLSQSKVSEWIYFLSPVLEESLKQLGYMPLSGDSVVLTEDDSEYLLIDATERQVPRRCDYQAQEVEYSGKKGMHTIKNLALTNDRNQVLFISASYEGRIHDKTIWDECQIKLGDQPLLADLGFLGIDKTHPTALLPFKKPRGGELRKTQKQLNKAISRIRVRVEHVFAAIKRLKIIREKIRLKSYDIRDQMMKIATALHNLRVDFRAIQIHS